jgi:hypothetical protein
MALPLLNFLALAADRRPGQQYQRRRGTTSTRAPGVFDLVLFNHEYDTVPIRLAELGGLVDAVIFAQTAFTFSSGERKEVRFPVLRGDEAKLVRRAVLNATPAACWTARHAGNFHPPLKGARSSSKLPWCIQSAVRNMLGVLFTRAGGTDDDWALISDADEIASGDMVAKLRHMDPRMSRGVLVLNSIHHFKYTLRCAEVGTFTRGPIAISGAVLRQLGAQRARDGGRRSCIPVGHHGSCGRVARRPQPATSWQFSNFGGVESLKYKLKTNSFAATAQLLDDTLVLEREHKCKDHLDRGPEYDFNVTGWDLRHLPRAPDVPRYLETELARGKYKHFLDISAPADRKWSTVGVDDDKNLWALLPTAS